MQDKTKVVFAYQIRRKLALLGTRNNYSDLKQKATKERKAASKREQKPSEGLPSMQNSKKETENKSMQTEFIQINAKTSTIIYIH